MDMRLAAIDAVLDLGKDVVTGFDLGEQVVGNLAGLEHFPE